MIIVRRAGNTIRFFSISILGYLGVLSMIVFVSIFGLQVWENFQTNQWVLMFAYLAGTLLLILIAFAYAVFLLSWERLEWNAKRQKLVYAHRVLFFASFFEEDQVYPVDQIAAFSLVTSIDESDYDDIPSTRLHVCLHGEEEPRTLLDSEYKQHLLSFCKLVEEVHSIPWAHREKRKGRDVSTKNELD